MLNGLVGCISTPVATGPALDFRKGYDFAAVRSIAFANHLQSSAEVAVFGVDITESVETELRSGLEAAGYNIVGDPAAADLVLVWHLLTQEKVKMRSYDVSSYFRCWRCGPSISDVEMKGFVQGTFVIELRDVRSSESVWRSAIEGRIEQNVDPQARQRLVQNVCQQMLQDFPPPRSDAAPAT